MSGKQPSSYSVQLVILLLLIPVSQSPQLGRQRSAPPFDNELGENAKERSALELQSKLAGEIGCYCAVSVNVAMGCPSANCPPAVTCTVPGVEGRVSTTAALPAESVVTMRAESEPPVVLKKTVPPAVLPPARVERD